MQALYRKRNAECSDEACLKSYDTQIQAAQDQAKAQREKEEAAATQVVEAAATDPNVKQASEAAGAPDQGAAGMTEADVSDIEA